MRLRNECTEILFFRFLVLCWKGREMGRIIPDSIISLSWEISEESSLEWDTKCLSKVNDQAQDLWDSLETSHPRRSLRVKKKKKQPAIQLEKNQEPERGRTLLFFGHLWKPTSSKFWNLLHWYVRQRIVFPYKFGIYINITDRNYFQPSPYSFVISLSHLWFIPQPQLSIYN